MSDPTGRPRGQPSPIADPVQRARYISLQSQLRRYRKEARDLIRACVNLDQKTAARYQHFALKIETRMDVLRQHTERIKAECAAIKADSKERGNSASQHQQESN